MKGTTQPCDWQWSVLLQLPQLGLCSDRGLFSQRDRPFGSDRAMRDRDHRSEHVAVSRCVLRLRIHHSYLGLHRIDSYHLRRDEKRVRLYCKTVFLRLSVYQ